MKVILIGGVEFSQKVLALLITLKVKVVGVVTPQRSGLNADFADLTGICRRHSIPCKAVVNINDPKAVDWMRDLAPDIMFCFGFSQILSEKVLRVAPMGVVGFHPTQLPQNRGRHPIVWTLVLGLKQTASTFFFLDRGVDSGDILSQKRIAVSYQDDARTLYDKIIRTALKQVKEFIPQLETGKYRRVKQDHRRGNVWRKRGEADGRIDFRMSSRKVYDLVRGLTKPYVGAHVVYGQEPRKVWKVREVNMAQLNVEPGKVLRVKNGQILVKCAAGAVWLVKHELNQLPKVGEYFL